MSVTTQVSNNLLISESTTASATKNNETSFMTSITQKVDGLLEPASTVDGVNYYWTDKTNVLGSGDASTDTYTKLTGSTNYDAAFRTNYSPADTCVAYVDYAFQLKAINTGTASDIKITKLDLVYGGKDAATTALDTEKAFRTAIFVEPFAANGNPTAGVGTLHNIYRDASSYNFNQVNPGTTTPKSTPEDPKAVDSTSTIGAVTYNTAKGESAGILATVAANTTQYYKVVVRLWLEGEDCTCNNSTFANLTDGAWALDMALEMGGTTSKVTAMTQSAQTIVNINGKAITATGAVTIDSVTYNVITSGTLDGKQLYTTAVAGTVSTTPIRVFVIVDNHPIEVSNQVSFAVVP